MSDSCLELVTRTALDEVRPGELVSRAVVRQCVARTLSQNELVPRTVLDAVPGRPETPGQEVHFLWLGPVEDFLRRSWPALPVQDPEG